MYVGFSICHDTVPLQIKIESCSNNNCNSNKDIKKAKYINFILLLGQTRRHTFLTSLHKIKPHKIHSVSGLFMEDVSTPKMDFSFSY